MIKILTFNLFLLISLNLFSQSPSPSFLNGFKYVSIREVKSISGYDFKNEFIEKAKDIFGKIGINLINEDSVNFKNPCEVLNCYISYSWQIYIGQKISLDLTDCKNSLLYHKIYEKSTMNLATHKYFMSGFEKAFGNLLNYKDYFYDSTLTPNSSVSNVEKIVSTEKDFKEYFDNNKISLLEGIYKTFQGDPTTNYKFAIKKFDDSYKAVILESNNFNWKIGDVKAILEPTSINSVFSTSWFMANKSKIETFSELEKGSILTVDLPNQDGTKRKNTFIKTYPIVGSINSSNGKGIESISTGSGFLLSSNGLIATNAHVVEGAKSIKVKFLGANGVITYNAKIELKDARNDVAIIKIDDISFKDFESLPYSLEEKCNIGEKAFTIGYPLNDVMGTNYKLTDGIISSNTGVEDDIRYYQITVPIQPGNSGGPLFNKDGNIVGITSAKLNSKAVGTNVENVNYAIKIAYLNNILSMLPSYIPLSQKNILKGKDLVDQTKILKNFVCLIEVSN